MLKDEVKQLINEMAEEVRKIYNIEIPITDIDQVVRNMSGGVVENWSLDEFSDGKIRKAGQVFVIEVSPYQSKERRNFIIAHQLGHLFLHMGFGTERWKEQGNGCYSCDHWKLGAQANEFANAFLMPHREYKEIMDKYTEGNMVNTSEVAKYFHVRIDVAANRGERLGYLRW